MEIILVLPVTGLCSTHGWKGNRHRKKGISAKSNSWQVKVARTKLRFETHKHGCPCGVCKKLISIKTTGPGKNSARHADRVSRPKKHSPALSSSHDHHDGRRDGEGTLANEHEGGHLKVASVVHNATPSKTIRIKAPVTKKTAVEETDEDEDEEEKGKSWFYIYREQNNDGYRRGRQYGSRYRGWRRSWSPRSHPGTDYIEFGSSRRRNSVFYDNRYYYNNYNPGSYRNNTYSYYYRKTPDRTYRRDIKQTIQKHLTGQSPVVQTFRVDLTLRRKINFILKHNIAEEIFAESASDFKESFNYDRKAGKLIITALPESLARILTILYDYDSYKSYISSRDSGTRWKADVVSLADLALAGTDRASANKIAKENFGNIKKLLNVSDWRYRSSGKRCLYNSSYYTVTIMDNPEKIEEVKEFMLYRSYSVAEGVNY